MKATWFVLPALMVGCERPYVRIFEPVEGQEFEQGETIRVFGTFYNVKQAKNPCAALALWHDGVPVDAITCDPVPKPSPTEPTWTFTVDLTAGNADAWISAEVVDERGEDRDMVLYRSKRPE